MNTAERLLDFASSEKDKKESETPMTALDTLKCGLRWSSDCSGGDVVWCLWSSIVARQQATVTLRAAAKHTVLRSRRTSLKVDVFSHMCERKTQGSGVAKLCTSIRQSITASVLKENSQRNRKKKNKTEQNKPINTHPTESKTISENSAVVRQLYFRNLWLSLNQLGRTSMTVCKWIKCPYQNTKALSTITSDFQVQIQCNWQMHRWRRCSLGILKTFVSIPGSTFKNYCTVFYFYYFV